MLPRPGSDEERELILELMALPPFRKEHADGLELGSKWIDITCAAVLLSNAYYWPANAKLRASVAPHPIAKGTLASVRRVVDVKDGRVCVIFKIAGRSGADFLAERRWLYGGELHPVAAEYRHHLSNLLDVYFEARESARKRFGNLRDADKAKGDESFVIVANQNRA
jgi:hypothetical protein